MKRDGEIRERERMKEKEKKRKKIWNRQRGPKNREVQQTFQEKEKVSDYE